MSVSPSPSDPTLGAVAQAHAAPPTSDLRTSDLRTSDASGSSIVDPREVATEDASAYATAPDGTPTLPGELASLIPDVRHPTARGADAGDTRPTLGVGPVTPPTLDLAMADSVTRDAGTDSAVTRDVHPYGDLSNAVASPIARVAAALADRYTVVRRLGRGGMATVYLARDVKHGRDVAVKLLHPELGASIGGARFLQEIRVAAALQHPHVLGLYDSGEVDGLLYYVMPFVAGESLRDRLAREGPLPLDEALNIACEVANALAYAHAQGIVHRDIKPENILLANGHAVVADFGIARAMRAAGGDRLTETGMAVGTPQYMSPEQGTGATDVGPPSDVYAAGCVLYEMLVGEPPFTGPNAMAIIARHAMAEVPSVRVVRSAAPPVVERLVARALAKTPVDRWPTAHAFEQAITAAATQVAAGSAVTADVVRGRDRRGHDRRGPGGGSGGWWPSTARRRATLGGLALAVAATAGVVTWKVREWSRSTATAAAGPDARQIAVRYFDTGGDAALRPVADGLTESLATALGRVPGLEVTSAGGTLPYRDGAVTNDSVARALSVGTLVTGRLEAEGAGRVRLTVTLRDASGAPFADSTVVRPAGDLLRLREDVVEQAAALVRRRLGEAVTVRAALAGTSDAQAWALAQQGLAAAKRAAALAITGDAPGMTAADSAADRALAAAAARDPKWALPVLERSHLAYEQSRRHGADAAYAAPHVARAVTFADAAVRLDSMAAVAIGARGVARYWEWLLHANAPDDATRERNLAQAAADLERATRLDASQADAWSALSHYYISFRGKTDAKVAALRAYQADAYLTGADALLGRLYQTSYELAQFDEARRFCGELGRRYPASPRTGQCRLWLLSTPDAPPAPPALAWSTAAAYAASAPPAQRPAATLTGRVGAAAALAHANLPDSARHVLAAALADPGASDPKLALAGAWVYTQLGDNAAAVDLLKRFVTVEPSTAAQVRREMAENWWWRSLQPDPRYRALFNLE